MRHASRAETHGRLEPVEEEVLGKAYDSRLMRRLMGYMRPYRMLVAVSLVFLLAQSGLQVLGPLLTRIAVDKYLQRAPYSAPAFLDSLLPADPWNGLTRIALLYLAMLLGTFFAEFAQTYLMQYTGQLAMFDLRKQLMEHLQGLDLAFYDRNPVGRLVTRVTTDVDVLNDLFASGLVTILGDVLVLAFILAIMFRMSPPLTCIMLAAMPFVILVTVVFRRTVAESYRRIRVAIAKINSYLQEHITGIVVLQLFNRERRSSEEFERVNREHMDAYKDAITAYGWFYPVVEFISMIALAGILTWGGFRIRSGALDPGGGRRVPAIRPALLPADSGPQREVQHPAIGHGVVRADLQAARHPGDAPRARRGAPGAVLHRGHRVRPRLVRVPGRGLGATGRELHDRAGRNRGGGGTHRRGKDHAHQPAASFLRREQGQHPDRRRRPARVRSAGVAAPVRRGLAGPLSLHRNARREHPAGHRTIGREEVEAAAEQVNVADFIRGLPQGFAHPIRERGSGLSTGQKQLIGFARALAHNPRYLILDEATSSVDTETEFRVREALGRMVEGRTSIVIAHRLSTIQRANRILVMHKARLRESGTHQELLAERGIYWKLYQLQYKDQELRTPQAETPVR